jgi:glycosyltransferase involved in cell wall biosynthesis
MERDNILFIFIGDGKMKKHLVERAKKENINNCRFYDSVPKSELTEVVASADVGLMILAKVPAFYYGTSPNKFFDYIAAGLPVLNNYPGWLADMINENQLGVVVSPGNPESFAKGLIRLMDDDKYRETCGLNARRFAEENFSRMRLSESFVSFLEEVYYS